MGRQCPCGCRNERTTSLTAIESTLWGGLLRPNFFSKDHEMDEKQPLAIARRLADSILETYEVHHMRWHYEDGLFLMSLFRLGEALKDEGYYASRVKASYDTLVRDDGTIATYRKEEYNLDQINAGRVLFDLYHTYKEEKYRKAIESLMNQIHGQPRTHIGNFWHKQIYPWQVWLDGLYMAGPFYARYIAEFVSIKDYSDIVMQLIHAEEKTRDERTGLLYHAWDESMEQLWADPATGCSPHFWGRALGWYCMAIVDILDILPRDSSYRKPLVEIVKRLAKAILAVQDDQSGLWYQVLDQKGRIGNYLESSASAMFCYFLLKCIINSYCSDQKIRSCAEQGYKALLERQIRIDDQGRVHLDGICSVAGLGGKPYRNGSYAYYVKEPVVSDDFKGVGPFILASIAYNYWVEQSKNDV